MVTVEDGLDWLSQTTVTVTLLDVNDNPPVFGSQVYQALLPATSATGGYWRATAGTMELRTNFKYNRL